MILRCRKISSLVSWTSKNEERQNEVKRSQMKLQKKMVKSNVSTTYILHPSFYIILLHYTIYYNDT